MSQRKLGTTLGAKSTKVVMPLGVAFAIAISGCSSSTTVTTADATSPSSVSASTSASASENKAEKSASATEATSSEPASESYEGAEALASAKTVNVDTEEVRQTEDLYNSFEESLTAVEMIQPQKSEDEEEAEEDPEVAGTSEGYGELSEASVNKIKEISTGGASDGFQAQAFEFGINGWKQEGSSKIVGEPKLAESDFNGAPAKLLEVCLDSSDVVIKDAAGNSLTNKAMPSRSLNIFTLVQEDGKWKIADHAFPNNPDC